nr:immunoglobulin heavy chain junction region [Macaca mulatta]MOY21591.1 immunoglobulin heavy chain junction region [Macaca mulatta]MOY21726.1 immunoglobulin heavy chain junction region [Macaca mulatta]MOY22112.1 immunoglobulin heavy chain junction region [Macaca mulatta]MOY22260.1 immunoglobulin heavy chain junction region [Macaca mulatta]
CAREFAFYSVGFDYW